MLRENGLNAGILLQNTDGSTSVKLDPASTGVRPLAETPVPPSEEAATQAPAPAIGFERVCFVITPIGEEDSEERRHATMILRNVIEPVTRELNLVPVRADQIDRAGLITKQVRLVVGAASETSMPDSESVTLAVTSPPFLDVVNYNADNWLRCWFCGIDAASVPVTLPKDLGAWTQFVASVLTELRRVLRVGGHVAFEVGDVRGGALRFEESGIPAGMTAGLDPVLVLINAQDFTKTSNCWGVTNHRKGTNTHRVVVFRKTR